MRRGRYTGGVQFRPSVTFAATLLAGAAWWACSNSSAGGGGGPDAGEAGEDVTVDVQSEPECDPCYDYCACTPGDSVYSPTACMTYVCPGSGVWGKFDCLGHGCMDAAEEEEASSVPSDATAGEAGEAGEAGDATSVNDSATTDGPTDAPRETTPDAPGEAAGD